MDPAWFVPGPTLPWPEELPVVALSMDPFCIAEPLVIPLPAVPEPVMPELPIVDPLVPELLEPLRAGPPALELPAALFVPCANANVLESANAVASAIVLTFMVVSSRACPVISNGARVHSFRALSG